MAGQQLIFHDEARDRSHGPPQTVNPGVLVAKARLADLGRARRVEVRQGQASGRRIVARALEAPLRRSVPNAGDESSVVLHRLAPATEPAFGCNAAMRGYGDRLQMGVIDLAMVTRLALQNAGSIAALTVTTDGMIVSLPAETPTAPLPGAPG